MDYLTFFAILLVVWPAYGIMIMVILGINNRMDKWERSIVYCINSIQPAVNYCNQQRNRVINDSLDKLITSAADKVVYFNGKLSHFNNPCDGDSILESHGLTCRQRGVFAG